MTDFRPMKFTAPEDREPLDELVLDGGDMGIPGMEEALRADAAKIAALSGDELTPEQVELLGAYNKHNG